MMSWNNHFSWEALWWQITEGSGILVFVFLNFFYCDKNTLYEIYPLETWSAQWSVGKYKQRAILQTSSTSSSVQLRLHIPRPATPHLLLPQPPVSAMLPCASLTVSHTFIQWEYLSFYVLLISCSIMSLRFTSMLSHMAEFPSFLRLSNIPLCICVYARFSLMLYAPFSLFIHPAMDV